MHPIDRGMVEEGPTTISNVKCPHCQNNLTVGIGTFMPKALYALKPADLEDKKKEFLELVEKSTMTQEQKDNVKRIYGSKDVMIDPQYMQMMIEKLKKEFLPTGGTILK